MSKDDKIRLQHMLDAAKEAVSFVRRHGPDDLKCQHVWLLGLVKCTEILGEAAARISEETRERYKQIPWAQIIAMRNRLVHAYFDIDFDQVWKAATEDIPPLVAELERILELK